MLNQCPCPICERCEDKPCICEYPCSQCCHTSLGGRPCQCRRALRFRNCRRDDCPRCMPYPPYERNRAQTAYPANQQAPRRMQANEQNEHCEQYERPPFCPYCECDPCRCNSICPSCQMRCTLNVCAARGADITHLPVHVAKTAINRNACVLL